MDQDLSHLPPRKQQELKEIVRLIRDHAEVELIVLYGSYARGDWKEAKDLDLSRWSGHPSDYDILVVVEEQATAEDALLWKRVSDALRAAGFSASPRLMVSDLNEMNMNLSEDRYFYRDITRQGRLLYSAGRYSLAEPRALGPKERLRLAREYFESWFGSAKRFVGLYEYCLSQDDLRLGAFNLNQATESAYKCILLVYTLYSPHEHRLEDLRDEAAEHVPALEAIFPLDTPEQRRLFELLDNAYIGSRYHPRFKVTAEDLAYLAPLVQRLLDVTGTGCRAEIGRLEREADAS